MVFSVPSPQCKERPLHIYQRRISHPMEHLFSELANEKVWWHKTLFWRNISARCAVFHTFMLEGIFMGVWSFYLSDIQDRLDLSDSELGTAVLFVYFGMVLVSGLTAYTLRILGSKLSMYTGAMGFGISLSFIPLSDSLGMLIFTMLLYGCTMGVMDISMNSCAILTEIVAGKPLLGSFHGSYSVAAAIGSVLGGALSTSNASIYTVFLSFSSVSMVLTTILHSNMYNYKQEQVITEYKNRTHSEDRTEYSPLVGPSAAHDCALSKNAMLDEPLIDHSGTEQSRSNYDVNTSYQSADDLADADSGPLTSRPKWIIAFYSMVGFLAAFGESSVVTWSIVYFDRALDASSVLKSLGFTSFMICMALGRFSCDYLRARFGRRLLVRVGGLLACSGLSLVVLSPDLPCGIAFGCIGFSITGMGLSTLIPTMFSSAGHIPGGTHAGTSIAIVSMFTNCGAICSSPLVGVLSDSFDSMRLAFLCDAILLGIICPLSWGIPEESKIFRSKKSISERPPKVDLIISESDDA